MTLVVYLAVDTTPEVGIIVVPASAASGHPSPSLSKSNLFGIPSVSVSKSVQEKIAGRVASDKIIFVSEDAL